MSLFSFLLIAVFAVSVIGVIVSACINPRETSSGTPTPADDSLKSDDFDPFDFHLYGPDRTAMHFKKSGFLDSF